MRRAISLANLYPNVRGFTSAILRNTVYVSVRAMNEKSGTDDWRQPVTKSRGAKTSSPCVMCTYPRATGYSFARWVTRFTQGGLQARRSSHDGHPTHCTDRHCKV